MKPSSSWPITLTAHAIARYVERVAPILTFREAAAALNYFIRTTRAVRLNARMGRATALYLVPETGAVFVVREEREARVAVTVLAAERVRGAREWAVAA